VAKYIPWIEKEGLKKMSRHHVHLSPDIETAEKVASRRDTENVILEIDAKTMAQKGFDFFVSSNGVWLTDRVPPEFISNLS
jgi:putative RNA 2'-phosphotransferase